DVNTTSCSAPKRETSAAMRSTSSGITVMRRTSTPRARSSRHRYEALASTILPDRISLPTRMIPAVFGIGRILRPDGQAAPRPPGLGEKAPKLPVVEADLARRGPPGDRFEERRAGTTELGEIVARGGRRGGEPGDRAGEREPLPAADLDVDLTGRQMAHGAIEQHELVLRRHAAYRIEERAQGAIARMRRARERCVVVELAPLGATVGE